MTNVIAECCRCHGQGLLRTELDVVNHEQRIYIQCDRCGTHSRLIRIDSRSSMRAREMATNEAIRIWNEYSKGGNSDE